MNKRTNIIRLPLFSDLEPTYVDSCAPGKFGSLVCEIIVKIFQLCNVVLFWKYSVLYNCWESYFESFLVEMYCSSFCVRMLGSMCIGMNVGFLSLHYCNSLKQSAGRQPLYDKSSVLGVASDDRIRLASPSCDHCWQTLTTKICLDIFIPSHIDMQ